MDKSFVPYGEIVKHDTPEMKALKQAVSSPMGNLLNVAQLMGGRLPEGGSSPMGKLLNGRGNGLKDQSTKFRPLWGNC